MLPESCCAASVLSLLFVLWSSAIPRPSRGSKLLSISADAAVASLEGRSCAESHPLPEVVRSATLLELHATSVVAVMSMNY